MDKIHRPPLLRIANRVLAALRSGMGHQDHGDSLQRVVTRSGEITRLARRVRICRNRGWTGAEAHTRNELRHRLDDLDAATHRLASDLTQHAASTPTLRSVFEDLRELEEEFGAVQFDRADHCVTVATEPIVLEDVSLGSFELRLCLRALARGDDQAVLRAVALQPNPSASNDAVTHPHINAERVCLGDALAPFQAALVQGRLADALVIVRSVLRNYNSASPYCPLESWYGRPCADCGYTASGDDCSCCEYCGQDYCDQCFTSCAACCESSCVGCLCTCPQCEERVCDDCLTRCARCDERACTSCLDDGLCPSCLETSNPEENDNDDASQESAIQESPVHEPPVHETAVCVDGLQLEPPVSGAAA